MVSSEDFKRILEFYNQESKSSGVSIEGPGRENGGIMLAINGGVKLWYIEGITNMRYGKYRLFSEVQALDMDPYNGDAYIFMSKDRRMLKIIRYKSHKRLLYDITYENGYKFMKPVMKNHEVVYELDFLIWRDKIS